MSLQADGTKPHEQGVEMTGAEKAWSHISFAEPDPWIDEPSYDSSIRAKEGAHLTYLLWMRQVDVESSRSFHATALRLETSVAVQHQSQWRVDLDPRNQHVVLHWLRVVRDGQSVNHLKRDRMRLIQRESQLDHLVIDGNWTLLVVLDDVRPGDVIESAYSFVTRHPIRPDGCEVFFVVPPGIQVGRFYLSITFDPTRPPIAWKASPDAPTRTEELTADGRTCWKWPGSQITVREPEANQPSTFLDYLWIQVSDLAEWRQFSARVVEIWNRTWADEAIESVIGFTRPNEISAAEICRLVRFIQNEFRYLSVDLESGGWVPATPRAVAHRRYGDCKDLTWLATCLLRRWGIKARPILVATGLRERAGDLLPMTLLFNHVVLEVEIDGKSRWFDLTLRHQVGNFENTPVPWFALGLPVDANASGLCQQLGSRTRSIYAIRETVLIDTHKDKPSVVECRVRAEGWHADNLRRNRRAQGTEEFANERLKLVQRRYAKATRIGTLQWRDNFDLNVCELVETFEINNVIYLNEQGDRALFDAPPNIIMQSFAIPDDKPRRGPWDMPHPAEIRHAITIRAPGMGSGKQRRRRWSQPEFTATLDEPRTSNGWTKSVQFVVNTPQVSADRVSIYRGELDQFLQATTWRLYLPKNRTRPQNDDHWGQLPPVEEGAAAYVRIVDPKDFPDAKDDPDNPDGKAIIHGGDHGWWKPHSDSSATWPRLAIPAVILLMMISRACISSFDTPSEVDFPRLTADRLNSAKPANEKLSLLNSTPGLPPGWMKSRGLELTVKADYPQLVTQNIDYSGPTHPPQIIRSFEPTYPKDLLANHTEGRVVIEFLVDTLGSVKEVKVIDSTDPLFAASAVHALGQWQFKPAKKFGQVVAQRMQVPFVFSTSQNLNLTPQTTLKE